MRRTWPLFECLSPESLALLEKYQLENYGTKLDIPAPPGNSDVAWQAVLSETSEEFERLMKRPPSHPKKVT